MALPFLPSIAGVAKSPKVDKKFVMMYVPNGFVRRGFFPGEGKVESPGFRGGFAADKEKWALPATHRTVPTWDVRQD